MRVTPDIANARQWASRRKVLNDAPCRKHAWIGVSWFFNNDYTLIQCGLCGATETRRGNRLNVNPFEWSTER